MRDTGQRRGQQALPALLPATVLAMAAAEEEQSLISAVKGPGRRER